MTAQQWLDIDATSFRSGFAQQPFTIGHRLAGHPLFEIPRLIELARALPPALVEYNAGDLAIYQDPSRVPTTGLGIEETLRQIGARNSWMVLKLVDRDPEYRAMLTECLDEIRAHSEALFPGMRQAEAFIFVSSAGAVTPYHMDPEHNFLLQIRGLKTMTVFDATVVSDVEREAMHAGEHRNMAFHDAYNAHSRTFDLTPGTGLHVPVGFPHYVKVGPDVSVSFSVTFRTPDLDRLTDLHNANRLLRARGLTPSPVGRSAWRDELKYQGFRAWRKLRRK